jgi:glycine hydroxymethyltransferase
MVTSGVRLGTPAGTTRGFGVNEFRHVGDLICEVLDAMAANPDDTAAVEADVRGRAEALCRKFPIYS